MKAKRFQSAPMGSTDRCGCGIDRLLRRYEEADADNARWEGFALRPGDVIIDAPSKSGTTWTQLLVALLIFDGPDFPASIGELSPWMELKLRPVDEVHGLLARQSHRRFIKSHTPLDGLAMHPEVRYLCVGRDPRDAAISMFHHGANLDRARIDELTAHASIDAARRRAAEVAPAAKFGIWRDPVRFFRQGSRGEGRHAMTAAQQARYDRRLSSLPADFMRWMHEGGSAGAAS